MKGIVKRSFADGRYGVFHEGQEIDIPKGVDWVKADLVEKVSKGKKSTEDK